MDRRHPALDERMEDRQSADFGGGAEIASFAALEVRAG
jgi:hypothetical protein